MARELTPKQQAFISQYVGKCNGNGVQAARMAGYAGNTHTLEVVASENLRKPEIAAAVAAHKAEVERDGIANRTNRVAALNRRQALLEQVIAERAAHYKDAAPGTATGLVVRQIKLSSTGEQIEEWAVDTGVLKELRAHEEQAAKELGQWTEKHQVAITPKVLIGIDPDAM